MLLQLKDLASQKLISVPEEGLTFGREGGDAQVQVADMGVSKRHAEIFCEGGAWFLKDLGSSNGTMLANERIADATEILPGDVFQLSKRKFEVLKVVEEDAGAEEEEAPAEEEDAPPMTEPERKAAPARGKPAGAKAAAPAPAAKKPAAKAAPAKAEKKPAAAAKSSGGGGGDDEEMGSASVGQVLAGVPKAVGYYLVNVPLLLLNPFGTVRKAIEEQPRDPMGRMELIAWALPGNIVSAALSTVGSLIATIIVGGGIGAAIGGLISGLIVGAIVAVVGSVITGIVWHPFLTWIVPKLFKGETDARSRTNYFLQVQTAIIIAALPTALALIITAIRTRFGIPLIGIIPVLLSAVTSALSLFVTYKWFESFNVVKWVKIVLLVFMGLTALGALASLPGALSGGGGISVASTGSSGGDVDVGDVDDAQKQALEAMKAAGATAEQIKQAEDAYKQSRAAMKAAAAAGADAAKAAEEAAEAGKAAAAEAKEAAAEAKKEAKEAAAEAKKEGKKAPPAAEEKPEPKEEVKAAAHEEPAAPVAPPAAVPSGGGYGSWRAKFDNIEKRVTDDPTVLRKANVLKLYQDLQEKTSEADSAVRKDYKKADAKTQLHLRDAELYDTSGKLVDELHKALFGR